MELHEGVRGIEPRLERDAVAHHAGMRAIQDGSLSDEGVPEQPQHAIATKGNRVGAITADPAGLAMEQLVGLRPQPTTR